VTLETAMFVKKKGKVIGLRLKFSGDLDMSTTVNPADYQLSLIKKGRTRKAPVQYIPVELSSPIYSALADTVTLIPPKKLKSGSYRLVVISSASGGVLDASDRRLARDDETVSLSV
jgi:hypothetical protein